MVEYIKGLLAEKTPTYVVVDVNGVGYLAYISLNTYTAIADKSDVKIFIHEVIREDAHLFYGFFYQSERELFRQLISVSGVGASTGILFLSSMNPDDIRNSIVAGDVNKLKSIKGVGLKTAQRIIVELKDKLSKDPVSNDIFITANNTARNEALSALETLGFVRKNAEKIVDAVLKKDPNRSVEDIIKDALKQM